MSADLLAVHRAKGRADARRIIAHPERHGPQRILVAWCALNGVRRIPPSVTPHPRIDWWRDAIVHLCAPRQPDRAPINNGDVA